MSFNSVPVNGWPQLKELDELAQKVGALPTFTSSDKEAIEDLIANAQSLISVAEDGAAGVPFDNTGTDFNSTDVQGAIEEAATMGAGGVNYSTDEVETGKTWYNGDKIYGRLFILEETVTPNSTNASAWKSTGVPTTMIANLVDYTFYYVTNNIYIPDTGIIVNLNTQEDPGELSIKAVSEVAAKAIKAVYLEYTKTAV